MTTFSTWFLRGGWLLVAACFAIAFLALAVWLHTDEPATPIDEPTCPPVDLDTELRRLLEREGRS